jgi:hypothetical protein
MNAFDFLPHGCLFVQEGDQACWRDLLDGLVFAFNCAQEVALQGHSRFSSKRGKKEEKLKNVCWFRLRN